MDGNHVESHDPDKPKAIQLRNKFLPLLFAIEDVIERQAKLAEDGDNNQLQSLLSLHHTHDMKQAIYNVTQSKQPDCPVLKLITSDVVLVLLLNSFVVDFQC